ncbi:MAG: LacI family transcriptional regulator [Clostridiales bacterium]|mgnify:CR=1 FL=1|nr:LacI family transcriptional regulator [Clostridiales bacterium]
MTKRVTVKDVAKEAGVSVATVSYIMNNRSDQKISEATRKKVLQIANLLNYTPSFAAKSLATGRNNIIGVSYRLNNNTPTRNLEITNFVNILIPRLNRLKYDVLFMPIKAVEDNIPYNRNIDGIITIDLSHDEFKELANNYFVPIINVDMIVNDGLFYQVYSDIPSLISQAMTSIGDDCYLILENYENEEFMNYITSTLPNDRVIIHSDASTKELKKLNGKKAIILGAYLALILKPYLEAENIIVISDNHTEHILPSNIRVIKNDVSKKANVAINILLNSIDRIFDVTHDHKIL